MARIRCSFVIAGLNVSPSAITQATGLFPTHTWLAGESVQNTSLRRQENGWRITIDETSSTGVETVLARLLSVLRPHAQELRSVVSRAGHEAEFSCAVYLDDDSTPSMHFSRDVLQTLHELDAELDIDLYLNATADASS